MLKIALAVIATVLAGTSATAHPGGGLRLRIEIGPVYRGPGFFPNPYGYYPPAGMVCTPNGCFMAQPPVVVQQVIIQQAPAQATYGCTDPARHWDGGGCVPNK